jgi:hypothetical protein
MSLLKPDRKLFLAVVVTLLLTSYQLARIVAFINIYGGIEHDGGWMLSISRSLAEQGSYTTMVSTIVDPYTPAGINVDQKFDIQAPDGQIWFFTGNGIGPASIVPDALILKLFGTGFWALHLGPLLFYTAFMLLAAYLLYQSAGLGALILFHLFLFFYPHLSIFLSYEAMGEAPGMVYSLAAVLAFAAVLHKPCPRRLPLLLAGLITGLALNAKLITLWSISGIFIWAGLLWLLGIWRRRQAQEISLARNLSLNEMLLLGGGTLLPLILWELVHLIVLTRLTNFELYLQHVEQRLKFILDDGSGVGLQIHSGAEFFWDKFFVLAEVAHPDRSITAIIFAAILIGGITLIWLWRDQPYKQSLLALIWLGWLVNAAWFVGLAKTGWPRHFWFGLVLAIMVLSIVPVAWLWWGLKQVGGKPLAGGSYFSSAKASTLVINFLPLLASILLLTLIGWGFIQQPHVRSFFLPDEIVPYWREKQINNKYGASLPWIIIPRAAQAEVVAYLQQLPPEAHIYYPAQHKAAEISTQVGRVLYPLNRRQFMKPHPQDVALVSPTLIAPWMDPARQAALLELVRKDCPRPLLSNDYYMICPIN